MYKVVLLLTKSDQLSSAAFDRLWLKGCDVGLPGGPTRHVHNRAIGGDMPIENAPAATFDAADELWFVDAAAARDWFADPASGGGWLARQRALLAQVPGAVCGEAHVVWQREAVPVDPVKIITLPVRRAGMTPAAFSDHWIGVHSALALDGPLTKQRLWRLEACPGGGAIPAETAATRFDGAGAIEFADRADLAAEFASDHYREVMAPDEPRFTDPARSCAVMVEPHPISG